MVMSSEAVLTSLAATVTVASTAAALTSSAAALTLMAAAAFVAASSTPSASLTLPAVSAPSAFFVGVLLRLLKVFVMLFLTVRNVLRNDVELFAPSFKTTSAEVSSSSTVNLTSSTTTWMSSMTTSLHSTSALPNVSTPQSFAAALSPPTTATEITSSVDVKSGGSMTQMVGVR